MSQKKKKEGILFSAEIRVVGSYTDRLLNGILLLSNYLKCVALVYPTLLPMYVWFKF